MTLIKGFTEVRPVNAIPMAAGLMFGPVGALGCAFGNAAADFFGTFDRTSILGFTGNFIAAYLPYRMWHVFSGEKPNMHTCKNILIYIILSAVSGMAVAYILAFGLEIFFGLWIKTLYIYVLCNDVGFSVFLGMPLLIVFTSDSVNMKCAPAPRQVLPRKIIKFKKHVFGLFAICMSAMLAGVFMNLSMKTSGWMEAAGMLSAAMLVFLLI